MKVLQLELFYNKSIRLKKSLLLLPLLLYLFNLNAQEKNNVKLRIEPGVLLKTESENLGILFNIEPIIKFSKNTVIGLRFGIALNPQKFKINDSSQFFINSLHDNGVISFVPTFDYYLNENNYRPYIGLGIGYYLFDNIDVSYQNGSADVFKARVKNQVGILLRGGLELGNTRLGLEYNFCSKADIKIPNNQIIGTVDSSYLGVSLGFIILGRERRL